MIWPVVRTLILLPLMLMLAGVVALLIVLLIAVEHFRHRGNAPRTEIPTAGDRSAVHAIALPPTFAAPT